MNRNSWFECNTILMILFRDVCHLIFDKKSPGKSCSIGALFRRRFPRFVEFNLSTYKQTPEFTDTRQSTADYNVLTAFRPYILVFWEPFKINLWHISIFFNRSLSRREDGLSVLFLPNRYVALASLDLIKNYSEPFHFFSNWW